jgi:hypothetical protein
MIIQQAARGRRHQSAGDAAAARRALEAASALYDAAAAGLQRRLPRRHPDYVAALVNAALARAALRPARRDAVDTDAAAACRRGVRAVRRAGGPACGVARDLERALAVALGEARNEGGPGGPGETGAGHVSGETAAGDGEDAVPVAVWPVRCGVGLRDVLRD